MGLELGFRVKGLLGLREVRLELAPRPSDARGPGGAALGDEQIVGAAAHAAVDARVAAQLVKDGALVLVGLVRVRVRVRVGVRGRSRGER